MKLRQNSGELLNDRDRLMDMLEKLARKNYDFINTITVFSA
jgi:hypothetical protein